MIKIPGWGVGLSLGLVLPLCGIATARSSAGVNLSLGKSYNPLPRATDVDTSVEQILTHLTLDEKVRLLGGNGMDGFAIDRLGVPAWHMVDGGVGLTNSQGSGLGTAFPAGVAMAATWNPEAVQAMAQALGRETRNIGKNVLLGPCINIHRLPTGGRNAESFSEDPYLAGSMAAAYVRGAQSGGVVTTVKHYALNNQEQDRLTVDVQASKRAMHEIYLPAFKAAVDAGSWGLMAAYNKVNGTYASENAYLLNDVLKREWNFQGFVISDWGATYASTTTTAALAGLDLEMPQAFVFYSDAVYAALKNKDFSEAVIDEKIRRQLRAMMWMGFFDNYHEVARSHPADRLLQASQVVARQVADESIVLLKNRESLLPLDMSKPTRVALIGPNVAKVPVGIAGSSYAGLDHDIDLRAVLGARWPSAKITYDDGRDIAAATQVATAADVVVVVAGWREIFEGEGNDRTSLRLPMAQEAMVLAVTKANPHTVVILNSGSSAVVRGWVDSAAAVLQSWYLGQNAGEALVDVLSGETNPSGRLPDTFLRDESQSWALDTGSRNSIEYKEGIFVGYRHLDAAALAPEFEFGFGLSYTNFEYSQLKSATLPDGRVKLTLELHNTGSRAGSEVVQVYVHPLHSQALRPPQELKAFAKVALAAGEHKTVVLELGADSFRYYDETAGWVDDTGGFELRVGASSRDVRLTATRLNDSQNFND